MDNPPLKFQTRGAICIERNVAQFPNLAVKLQKIGQGLFVICSLFSLLENKGSVRGIVCDLIRSNQWYVILPSQQLAQFIEETKPLLVIVRAPHSRLQPRHFVRIELAHVCRSRKIKIVEHAAD